MKKLFVCSVWWKNKWLNEIIRMAKDRDFEILTYSKE